jgi:hypothetical protein
MATGRFGYILVIILQQLAITGLLWAAAGLLKHVHRLRHGAEMQIRRASAALNPARQEPVSSNCEILPKPAVPERARAFTAAAG